MIVPLFVNGVLWKSVNIERFAANYSITARRDKSGHFSSYESLRLREIKFDSQCIQFRDMPGWVYHYYYVNGPYIIQGESLKLWPCVDDIQIDQMQMKEILPLAAHDDASAEKEYLKYCLSNGKPYDGPVVNVIKSTSCAAAELIQRYKRKQRECTCKKSSESQPAGSAPTGNSSE